MSNKPLPTQLDVTIIGAGAAGVGMGVVLRDLGIKNFALLERHRVGASFDRWPKEMRFITPSFPSNQFGMLDLNAVALRTSPGYSLSREHPSGQDYGRYLRAVAKHWKLPVYTKVDVTTVQYIPDDEVYLIETSRGVVRSRFVIWAAGEFQYPRLNPFPGADLCLHNSQVRSWSVVKGDDFIIIGGYESGIDAAIHLSNLGKTVQVLDGATTWETDSPDPSVTLSPYTFERMTQAIETGRVKLTGGVWVSRVDKTNTGYVVTDTTGQTWTTRQQPILATGFVGSARLIADLFEWHDYGQPRLTEVDESTTAPGLFLVGPQVRQDKVIFCFIYKFRQRLAIIANAIGVRLGLDTTRFVAAYRAASMYLDDLSCCGEECAC